jgi:hypothetical protein
MDSQSALKPDVFSSFQDLGDKRTQAQKKKDHDPDDVALHHLTRSDGWPVLVRYIESLKRQMDELVAHLIANGGSFEDVGKITVVSNLAKDKLNDIIKRVKDAEEAIGG